MTPAVHSSDCKQDKVGGNVASYFLTPSGHVLHATLGPITPEELLTAAKWADELYYRIRATPKRQQFNYYRQLHASAAQQAATQGDKRIHTFLSRRPPQLLKDVYATVFESFLCETVSSDAEKLDKYRASITEAKTTNKPLLYLFNDTGPTSGEMPINQQTKLLMEEFVVIHASIQEAAAISQITNLPTPSRKVRYNDTLIVLTHPDGTEIEVPRVAPMHWKDAPDLTLAQALVKYYETHLPGPSKLPRIHRLILSIDHTLAAKLKEMEDKTDPQPENPDDGRETDNAPTDNDGNLAGTF